MAGKGRLGRPPATDSAESRTLILQGARRLFATRGYEATSNRAIADEAGFTTGAIYHYFDSKLALFKAVYADTQRLVYERFEQRSAGTTTFVERLRAVLEAAHDLNNEDPTLAQFLGSCRVDAARDPEVAAALVETGGSRRSEFFTTLIELGVSTGELDPDQAAVMGAVIQIVTVGLVDAVSHDRQQHRRAVDGVMALVEGTLVHNPANA